MSKKECMMWGLLFLAVALAIGAAVFSTGCAANTGVIPISNSSETGDIGSQVNNGITFMQLCMGLCVVMIVLVLLYIVWEIVKYKVLRRKKG